MNLKEIKAQIVDCCQRMWVRGYVANHDGNISYKVSPNLYIATPTSFSKKDVTEEDLLVVDDQGQVKEGKYKIFSEFSWHLAIYNTRPDIQCIVHGHPPAATGIGLSQNEIGTPGLPEAIVSLGLGIFTTKFFSPLEISITNKNPTFENEMKRVLNQSDAFLVPGNGAWAVGQGVMQTYLRLELTEQIAQATIHAKAFGGVKPLSRGLVEELMKKRPQNKIVSIALESTVLNKTEFDNSYAQVRKIVEAELNKLITK